MQWNCCVEEMCSQLQPLQFEGSIAREHESFVSTSSILGIGRKSRTKASFSDLQRLECQSSLARKHRFYIFNSWTWKEASHDSFVFTNHGCDLNVRICTKHCVFFFRFFRVSRLFAAEKSWLVCARVSGVIALAWNLAWIVRAVKLMVPGDFFCFFDDAVLLCLARVETLCGLELLR